VQQVGRPIDLYNRPDNLFVAGFIGSPKMNFLKGALAERVGAATIGIRPEHLRIDPDGEWSGTVRHVEHLGSDSYLYIALAEGQDVTVRIPEETAIGIDEVVRLSPQAGRIHRFGADDRSLDRAA
jgi:multiple sugar transport system ATP-binding protein